MNRNFFRCAACAALLTLTGASCASGGNDTDSGADAPQTSATANASTVADAPGRGTAITVKLIAFAPADVQLPAGGTVTWRQEDVATHTVTSGRVERAGGTATAKPDGRFDSGNISKGQTFEFSFAEPGQYPFFCAIHPATMTGTVTVT
ncbi:MAG: plastocyanin/azurin family copper-binding protein [Actinomycetota bacterium]|jgi:plastocyanin